MSCRSLRNARTARFQANCASEIGGLIMLLYTHNPIDAHASIAAMASSAMCFFTHNAIWLITQFALA